MFTPEDKQFMVRLARKAIAYFLETGEKLVVGDGGVYQYAPTRGVLIEPHACFVTLTKNFELRGCVGHLEATQPLYVDIIDNAIAAAVEDDRFFPVTKEELAEIQIEISVLTKPEPVDWPIGAQNIVPLQVGVDGVIIEKDGHTATYLPQVWDEILDKHDFMSSLCLKAGLEPDAWQKPGVKVFKFKVEIVTEETPVRARVG